MRVFVGVVSVQCMLQCVSVSVRLRNVICMREHVRAFVYVTEYPHVCDV